METKTNLTTCLQTLQSLPHPSASAGNLSQHIMIPSRRVVRHRFVSGGSRGRVPDGRRPFSLPPGAHPPAYRSSYGRAHRGPWELELPHQPSARYGRGRPCRRKSLPWRRSRGGRIFHYSMRGRSGRPRVGSGKARPRRRFKAMLRTGWKGGRGAKNEDGSSESVRSGLKAPLDRTLKSVRRGGFG